MIINRVLTVKEPWARLILSGQKTLEIRGAKTSVRGLIGIATSGTGAIQGVVELYDCTGPLNPDEFSSLKERHLVNAASRYKTPFGWGLRNAIILREPVRFARKRGAIIWTILDVPLEIK